jgi:omega-6 fatty acid desaturase (delta-12 desaturase)
VAGGALDDPTGRQSAPGESTAAAPAGPGGAAEAHEGGLGASLRELIAPWGTPSLPRSLLDLATSVGPYLALLVAIYFALRVSTALALLLAIPATGFLLRTFIVFHDCAHASFFRSRRANEVVGSALGVLLFTPFRSWRHKHAVHHASAGHLDRRGVGDIQTLTVAEYWAKPWLSRVGYRLFRNPLVMFGLGPFWVVLVGPRLVSPSANKRMRRSILGTDAALVALIVGLCLLIGWQAFVLVQIPVLLLTGAAGIWLFYVQHQFEGTYWERGEAWRYDDAALRGSSFLKLPRALQFFTGNIGFHHVHHLSARIPNYNLQTAHNAAGTFQSVPTLTLRDALRAPRLKLWDEQTQSLVTFRQARAYGVDPALSRS